jgi:hypothetical protein
MNQSALGPGPRQLTMVGIVIPEFASWATDPGLAASNLKVLPDVPARNFWVRRKALVISAMEA